MISAKIPENRSPEVKNWHDRSVAELTQYIIAKHHEYLRAELPIIERLLQDCMNNTQEGYTRQLLAITRNFRKFRSGIENHLKKEEAILFPMIESLETAVRTGVRPPQLPFGTIQHPIAVMEQEHEVARRELAQIREFTETYRSEASAADVYSSFLSRFEQLEADLDVHSRLEGEVLFPRAIKFEQH